MADRAENTPIIPKWVPIEWHFHRIVKGMQPNHICEGSRIWSRAKFVTKEHTIGIKASKYVKIGVHFLFHRTSPRPNFSRAESANRHCRAVKRSLKRSENSLFGHLIQLDAYLSPGLRFRIRIWDPGPLQWFHSIKQTHFFLLQNHGYRRTPRMFEVFDLYTDQFHWVIVVFGGSEVTLFDLVELNRNSRWSKVQVFFWGNSCLSLHFHKKKAEQHWNVRFSILVGTNTE